VACLNGKMTLREAILAGDNVDNDRQLQPDDNDAHPSAVENVDGSGNRAVAVFVQHWILKFCNFYLFIFYSAFFNIRIRPFH
jgi:hypothetical protein